ADRHQLPGGQPPGPGNPPLPEGPGPRARRPHRDGGEQVDHLDHVQRQRQGKLGEDMDLAKARLLEAGAPARYVRRTFGNFDAAVLETYQSRSLKVILWDADSKDASEVRDPAAESGFRPANPAEVIGTLKAGGDSVPHAIAEGNRDLVVLFHDIS